MLTDAADRCREAATCAELRPHVSITDGVFFVARFPQLPRFHRMSKLEQFYNCRLGQWLSAHPQSGATILAGIIWSIIGAAMAVYIRH